jgi:DUF1009 family protein
MLALIAGKGGLPAAVVAEQAHRPLVCALEGFAPDRLDPDMTFRLEHLGTLLKDLCARGVTQVCFCGAIERPILDASAIDASTRPLVPKIAAAIGVGDDGALRVIMSLFEDHGLAVCAAHELAPGLLMRAGVLSTTLPDDQIRADADRGMALLAGLAPFDVGQACVVAAGQVWGVETVSGTDHMLASLPSGIRTRRASLIKLPKRGQDLRADLPTIGPETVEKAVAAGLAAIIVEAGKTILLEREETQQRADAAGLILWARDVP